MWHCIKELVGMIPDQRVSQKLHVNVLSGWSEMKEAVSASTVLVCVWVCHHRRGSDQDALEIQQWIPALPATLPQVPITVQYLIRYLSEANGEQNNNITPIHNVNLKIRATQLILKGRKCNSFSNSA